MQAPTTGTLNDCKDVLHLVIMLVERKGLQRREKQVESGGPPNGTAHAEGGAPWRGAKQTQSKEKRGSAIDWRGQVERSLL